MDTPKEWLEISKNKSWFYEVYVKHVLKRKVRSIDISITKFEELEFNGKKIWELK